MVAATDCPNKFKSRRDKIAELLFSCRVSRCLGCDHLELSVPGDDDEANRGRGTTGKGADEGGVTAVDGDEDNCKESKANSSRGDYSRRVLRSERLKTLIGEWKELVDQWVNTTKEITGAEGTPESANPSVLDEEEAFPSLPYDVDIFTPEPNGYEFSHFFDSLDFDGNPRNSGEYNTSQEHERRPQNIAKRRPEGAQMRIQDAPSRSVKPSSATDFDGSRRTLKQSLEQRIKNEKVSVHKSEKPMIQRKPLVSEQKRKALVPQQEKLKGLDADAKFEFAKRKLQESYQHHENAKKQRTIQVLETIPKQCSAQKPQHKRPGMSNRNWANGRK